MNDTLSQLKKQYADGELKINSMIASVDKRRLKRLIKRTGNQKVSYMDGKGVKITKPKKNDHA